MKRIVKIACISICVIFIFFLLSVPVVNNWTAKAIAENLKDIPLPQNTEYIESIYGAGKFNGNGNGMQYFGCILIKSDLTIDELNRYYSANVINCYVEEQHGQKPMFIEHGNLSFHTKIDSEKYYIVHLWMNGIELYSELDIRGH